MVRSTSNRARSLALASTSALLVLFACETTDPEARDAETIDAAPSGTMRDGESVVGDEVSSPDASRIDEARGLDAAPEPSRVGVFVAQGYAGRIAVSCDDGRSWRFDREDALTDAMGEPLPPVERCFSGVDCDHHPGRAKGIVFHRGWFVRTNGWGPPGAVRRSRDGIRWETVLDGASFGGIASNGGVASAGVLVLGARRPRLSTDDGATFASSENDAISGWNVRRAGFAAGRFVIVGNDGSEVGLSEDARRWIVPREIDPRCGQGIQNEGGIAEIGGAIVIVGGNGIACRSTDQGASWTVHPLPGEARPTSSDVLRVGDELWVWTEGAALRSRDGASWTRTPTEPRISVGAVARSPAGTFVAVRAGWNQWYEAQRFYRSTDGVRWEELAPEAARRSHPIGWIAWGEVDASVACRE